MGKPCWFKFLTCSEMDERRAKGPCFNCEETFSRDHDCKKLFRIVLDFPEGGRGMETDLDDDEDQESHYTP